MKKQRVGVTRREGASMSRRVKRSSTGKQKLNAAKNRKGGEKKKEDEANSR